MSTFLKPYGVTFTVPFPLVKASSTDFAASGNYTYTAGDIKIIKDGGASANPANSPSAAALGNTTRWTLALTAAEMQADLIEIWIADAATKAIQDSVITIQTYGAGVGELDYWNWWTFDGSALTGESRRSAWNAIRKLLNRWTVSGGTATYYKEDDTTSAYTETLNTATGGDIVTGSDPN